MNKKRVFFFIFVYGIVNAYQLQAISFETKYSRIGHVKFVEESLQKILPGTFLNTVSHLYI